LPGTQPDIEFAIQNPNLPAVNGNLTPGIRKLLWPTVNAPLINCANVTFLRGHFLFAKCLTFYYLPWSTGFWQLPHSRHWVCVYNHWPSGVKGVKNWRPGGCSQFALTLWDKAHKRRLNAFDARARTFRLHWHKKAGISNNIWSHNSLFPYLLLSIFDIRKKCRLISYFL